MSVQPSIFILLGPPASGKGTQAKRLKETLDLPHIASGDLFRDHISRGTELGKEAKRYIDRGDLVPDQLTIEMVRDRLNRDDTRRGAILDGFPRTVPQAEALTELLGESEKELAAVILISVPEAVLVERVSGRRICSICGRSYHVLYYPPEQPGKCDLDGGKLFQREDDRPEAVHQRLEVYRELTRPLIAYYRDRGVLHEVDGDQPIDQVNAAIREEISAVS